MLYLTVMLLWKLEGGSCPHHRKASSCVCSVGTGSVCRDWVTPVCCVRCFWFVPKILQEWCGLFIQTKTFNICVYAEEKIKLDAPEKAGKSARNILGKMVENHLLSGMLWFIDWNLIFNCTGLFLPKKYAYWLFGNLKRKDPSCGIWERSLQFVCSSRWMCSSYHYFVYYNKGEVYFYCKCLFVNFLNFTLGGMFCSFTLFCCGFYLNWNFKVSLSLLSGVKKLTTLKCLKYFTQGLLAAYHSLVSQFLVSKMWLFVFIDALKCFNFFELF